MKQFTIDYGGDQFGVEFDPRTGFAFAADIRALDLLLAPFLLGRASEIDALTRQLLRIGCVFIAGHSQGSMVEDDGFVALNERIFSIENMSESRAVMPSHASDMDTVRLKTITLDKCDIHTDTDAITVLRQHVPMAQSAIVFGTPTRTLIKAASDMRSREMREHMILKFDRSTVPYAQAKPGVIAAFHGTTPRKRATFHATPYDTSPRLLELLRCVANLKKLSVLPSMVRVTNICHAEVTPIKDACLAHEYFPTRQPA